MILDYGIAEFFGIFLVGLPLYIFLSCLLPWGIFKIFKIFWSEEGPGEQVYHHHFHYKDRGQ